MIRRNISWSDEVERLAKKLAAERGIPVSQLLALLLEAERDEARVFPECALCELSPGMVKHLKQKKEEAKKGGVANED